MDSVVYPPHLMSDSESGVFIRVFKGNRHNC